MRSSARVRVLVELREREARSNSVISKRRRGRVSGLLIFRGRNGIIGM